MSEALEAVIASLPKLGREALKTRWHELFKAAPPAAFTPDLLARGIAFRLQEKAHGSLAPARRRQIEGGGECSAKRASMRSGNRLVRRWRGLTYVVEAVEGGFAHDGQTFASLRSSTRASSMQVSMRRSSADLSSTKLRPSLQPSAALHCVRPSWSRRACSKG